MPKIVKDREMKASYLTASSTERALCVTLWFIISKAFLSKIATHRMALGDMERAAWTQLALAYTGMIQHSQGN